MYCGQSGYFLNKPRIYLRAVGWYHMMAALNYLHYGAVQKNNLTSVVTLASYLFHSFIVLVYTSPILRIRHKFIDDDDDDDDRNNAT